MSDPQGDSQSRQPVTTVTQQAPVDRWHLIRDAVQFQIKLAIDGVRDLILMPLSALGAILSLFGVRDTPLEFYNIVRWGKRTEQAINLFGAAKPSAEDRQSGEAASVDSLLARLESLVVEQYHKGGITAQAKDAIDRALGVVDRDKQS